MPRLRKGFRSRRGRPSINRPVIDHGTPELIAKRSLGQTLEVIDMLHTQAQITEAQHWCALHFRWLYCLRYGSPTVQSLDLDRHHPGAPSTEDEEWRQNRSTEYRTAANILQKQDLLSVVLRVAVFDDPAVLNPAGGMELRSNLCGALQLLAHLWSKKPSCTTRAPTPSAHSTTNAGHP